VVEKFSHVVSSALGTVHWREAQAFLELSEKVKALERGVAKDLRKQMPSTADLISIVEHEYKLMSKGCRSSATALAWQLK